MTTLTKRQKQIINKVTESGFATVEQLAESFEVTPQTIRSDINFLCKSDMLSRYHGGAALKTGTRQNTDWRVRQGIHLKEKERIATYIAQEVPNNSSLFMNLGTTTEMTAEKLIEYKDKLTIITNNLNIAINLAGKKDFEILIAGGSMRHSDRGVVGIATVDFVSQFHVDIAVIGISAINSDGILSDFDYQEVQVAKALIDNASKVILACDSSKFDKHLTVKLGSFEKIDVFITDKAPPKGIAEAAKSHGCEIIIV
ncbi:MAG: DeoR/GlpR family DNA-binding transcription regulator [Alphaproteobacteria bacterium]